MSSADSATGSLFKRASEPFAPVNILFSNKQILLFFFFLTLCSAAVSLKHSRGQHEATKNDSFLDIYRKVAFQVYAI